MHEIYRRLYIFWQVSYQEDDRVLFRLFRSLSFLQCSTRGPRPLNLARGACKYSRCYQCFILRRFFKDFTDSTMEDKNEFLYLLWLLETRAVSCYVLSSERETHSRCCASIWMSGFVSTRKWEESDPSGLPSDISHSLIFISCVLSMDLTVTVTYSNLSIKRGSIL